MIFNYYHIINVENKKEYIGITEKPIEHRFKQHRKMLETNTHVNYKLQFDWNLYGSDKFLFQLIESKDFDNVEDGYYHEYELIQSSDKELYNIAPGGQVNIMYSPEIKEKMIKTKQSQVPDIYCLKEIEENKFTIIGCFPSQKEAARAVSNWSQGNIQKAIKKHTKSYEYFWVEENDIVNELENWRPTRTKIRPTAQLDKDGNIVEVHHNARCFEQQYGYSTGVVSASICHGNKCHGDQYKYISEDEYYNLKPIILVK